MKYSTDVLLRILCHGLIYEQILAKLIKIPIRLSNTLCFVLISNC